MHVCVCICARTHVCECRGPQRLGSHIIELASHSPYIAHFSFLHLRMLGLHTSPHTAGHGTQGFRHARLFFFPGKSLSPTAVLLLVVLVSILCVRSCFSTAGLNCQLLTVGETVVPIVSRTVESAEWFWGTPVSTPHPIFLIFSHGLE